MGRNGTVRRVSDVTLAVNALLQNNPHPKAFNGLEGWDKGNIKKALEDAKSRGPEMFFYVFLSFLSLRNGGMRHAKYTGWKLLIPMGMKSDFAADAFSFRELLNIIGISSSSDVSEYCQSRMLDPAIFRELEKWNFQMTSLLQCLQELNELVKQGFEFKLPSRESFDQKVFTSIMGCSLWRRYGKMCVYIEAEMRGVFKNLRNSADRTYPHSQLFEPRERDFLIFDHGKETHYMLVMQGGPAYLDYFADHSESVEEMIKQEVSRSGLLYDLDFEMLPDEASLYRSWESAKPGASQKQPQAVSAATPAPAPKQIELIDLPEVPETLMAFPDLRASLNNLAAINEQLRKIQGMEESVAKARNLEAQIQALDLRLRQLHEEEVKLQEERELLATHLHQERQESVAGLDDPKALQAKGLAIKDSIEAFVQSAQMLSMA